MARNPGASTQSDNRAQMTESPKGSSTGFDLETYENSPVVETRNPLTMADVTEGPLNLDNAPAVVAPEVVAPAPATTVAPETESRWSKDPRFKGKSADDLYDSLTHNEKLIGRQGEELGLLRKRFDDSVLNPNPAPAAQKPSSDPNLLSRLLDNPEAVLKEVEDRAQERVLTHFNSMAHASTMQAKANEFKEVLEADEFKTWLVATVPQAVAIQAETSPETLTYIVNQFNNSRTPAPKIIKQEAERRVPVGAAAGVPQGGGGVKVEPQSFSRVDLMRMQDSDPKKYASMNDEIIKAYREGRVR